MPKQEGKIRELCRVLVWIVLLTCLVYNIIQRRFLGYDHIYFSPFVYWSSLILSTVLVLSVYYSKPIQELLDSLLIPVTFGGGAGLLISLFVQKPLSSEPDFRFSHVSFALPFLLVGGFFLYGRNRRRIRNRFNLYKPCPVCGKPAKECLFTMKAPRRYFCREHLLDEVVHAILSATAKIVLFDPKLKNQDTFFTYEFYPLARLSKKWKAMAKTVQKALDVIDGPCRECGLSAQVAYYSASSYKCHPDSDIPNYDELFCEPQPLCRSCAARYVRRALAAYEHLFEYPLCMPSHTEGAMFSCAW